MAANRQQAISHKLDLAQVRQGFIGAGVPTELVDEALESYSEAKRRFHLGDHRPQELEGGRFSEAVFRVLQYECRLTITPLGTVLPRVDALLKAFEACTGQSESIRLHIPRTLRLIYDIRNKRDAAHLSDGIDANLQDATLVIANLDWVMAELVRLHHRVGPNEAQRIIEDLVTKEVPAVQEIDGQPVVLAELKPREQAVLMVYRAGSVGVSLDDLSKQLRAPRKDHLRERLLKLDNEKLVLYHPTTGRLHITARGVKYVEEKKLARPA